MTYKSLKNKKKAIIITAICIIAYLVIYLSLTPMVYDFSKGEYALEELKQDINDLPNNSDVIFELFSNEYLSGLTENYKLVGYAFCITDQPITNEHDVKVILAPTDSGKAFITSTRPFGESTIKVKWGNKFTFDLQESSFEVGFSTLMLPTGQYTLYLYVDEGNGKYGLVDTGTTLIKTGRSMEVQKDIPDYVPNVLPEDLN